MPSLPALSVTAGTDTVFALRDGSEIIAGFGTMEEAREARRLVLRAAESATARLTEMFGSAVEVGVR